MADVNSCLIKSGISVQIRRTDGRTHPAIVSKVNNAMKFVIVEWFERGETKGKEIDFATIFALNANLLPSNINNQTTTATTELDRVTATSSWDEEDEDDEDDVDEDETEEDAEESRQDELTTADSHNGNLKHSATITTTTTTAAAGGGTSTSTVTASASTQPSLSIRSLPNPRTRTSMIALASQSRSSRQAKLNHSTNGFGGGNPSSANSRGVENIPPPAPPASHQNITRNNRSPGHPTVASDTAAVARKKANVVKEVEKLKKNREERRQKQAEKKEEKEALMNIDPGNPQWEFLAMIREYQASIDMRPLKETDPVETHQITVCVRKRPLNKKEMSKKEVDVITVPRKDLIVVHEPKNKVDLTKYLENEQFRFDYVFDETCSNELVYKYTAKPLVTTLFEGGMATCFAYGQTGSGKTHTMGGTFTGKTQNCKKGIYAMVAKDVFNLLNSPLHSNKNLVVSASFFEIYSGKVFDLLAEKAKLRVLEDGKQQVQIVGLTEKVVTTVKEVLELIQAGNTDRTSGQTSANSNSSRSHAVFQIVLRTSGLQKIFGKFSLIDLAGNERGADTSSASRLTRMEGAEINKSLLALKECIRALGKRGAHLPFRASKLTQVLRDSFICDNTKTCMIAMISPGMSSCEHSLNTLRYADRVKELATTGLLQEINNDHEQQECTENFYEPDDARQDDLATLRSLNEDEISADLYNFHEAVSQLQQTEEDMLDSLKTWRDIDARLRRLEDHLLSLTRNVDYDQDAFASQIDEVVKERLRCLVNVQDKIGAFKSQLVKEEVLSRKMNPNQ